jgi:hypothetical protein
VRGRSVAGGRLAVGGAFTFRVVGVGRCCRVTRHILVKIYGILKVTSYTNRGFFCAFLSVV